MSSTGQYVFNYKTELYNDRVFDNGVKYPKLHFIRSHYRLWPNVKPYHKTKCITFDETLISFFYDLNLIEYVHLFDILLAQVVVVIDRDHHSLNVTENEIQNSS